MFSPSRDQKIRAFLKQHQLQGWLAWRPDELLMMCGYMPFWGASVLLYLENRESILFVPVLEPKAHIPGGLTICEYPWGSLDCSDPFRVLLEKIRTELSEAKVEYTRVGMLRSGIRTSLPMQPAEQIPIPDLFWEQLFTVAAAYNPKTEAAFLNLYLQKTPEEINAIRLANQVACTGIRAFHESLAPGATEVEISAVIEAAIQKETGKGSVFYSRGWAMIQSGPNTADSGRFNRSTGRRLESGDLVLLELGTCVNGYWSDLTRTVAVGTASSKLEEILGVVGKAQGAAVAAVRPGIPAGEIDSTARNIIDRHGFSRYFTHATGHHVGFRYHDPGFGISPGETQQLLPGMIITVEPGIYVKEFGGGARLEDNILVTEGGHEVLSQETPKLAAA